MRKQLCVCSYRPSYGPTHLFVEPPIPIGVECPLWVMSSHNGQWASCPLYPQNNISLIEFAREKVA